MASKNSHKKKEIHFRVSLLYPMQWAYLDIIRVVIRKKFINWNLVLT